MTSIPSSESKAALSHGVKDLNELLIFNPHERCGSAKYKAKWTSLLDCILLSALLRQAVFLTSAEPENQIEITAGIDRLRGKRYRQTKIAKEVSPFHSALVCSIKTSADDTLWGGLLKQRLVENRYNEIEPHDCLPKEPEAGSHTTCCQAGCHKAEQPPQKCPYTILQDTAWTARVADTIIKWNPADMLLLFPLNRQTLSCQGLHFLNNTGQIILSNFYMSKGQDKKKTFMFLEVM